MNRRIVVKDTLAKGSFDGVISPWEKEESQRGREGGG